MPCWIKHHSPTIRKLIICNRGSAIDCILDCFFQIVNGKVQVRHLLLGFRLFRPHRRFILRIPLKHNSRIRSLLRSRSAYARPIFIMKRYFPLEKSSIEFCQFIRLQAVYRKCVQFDFQFVLHCLNPSQIKIPVCLPALFLSFVSSAIVPEI